MNDRLFPDTVYFPEDFPHPGDSEFLVKAGVRDTLLLLQDFVCPVCTYGLGPPYDMHEALISKGDVQGWPKQWKVIIYNVYNCVIIHRHCHEKWPSREEMWKYKCTLFDEADMKKWYLSLPLKRKVQIVW